MKYKVVHRSTPPDHARPAPPELMLPLPRLRASTRHRDRSSCQMLPVRRFGSIVHAYVGPITVITIIIVVVIVIAGASGCRYLFLICLSPADGALLRRPWGQR